jgi:hypothetical protein
MMLKFENVGGYAWSAKVRNTITFVVFEKQNKGKEVIYMAKRAGILILTFVILCNIATLVSSDSKAEEPPNWGIYTYYGCDGNWAMYHCEFPQPEGGCWPISSWHRQPCGCC